MEGICLSFELSFICYDFAWDVELKLKSEGFEGVCRRKNASQAKVGLFLARCLFHIFLQVKTLDITRIILKRKQQLGRPILLLCVVKTCFRHASSLYSVVISLFALLSFRVAMRLCSHSTSSPKLQRHKQKWICMRW